MKNINLNGSDVLYLYSTTKSEAGFVIV